MALFGSVSTVQSQLAPAPAFASVWPYLAGVLRPGAAADRVRSLAIGQNVRQELGGGAYALEQVYRSKARPEGFFESHRRYIDVQVVFEGEECLEVVETSRLAVRDAYNPERDLVVYEDCADATRLHLRAGEAAVFFPVDGHMPGLQGATGAGLVRKIVVKVPVA